MNKVIVTFTNVRSHYHNKKQVAFYSLEMSGPEGGKAFCQGAHREICRDPPDADGDPQYQVMNGNYHSTLRWTE